MFSRTMEVDRITDRRLWVSYEACLIRLRTDTGLSVEILIDRRNTVHQANEGTQEQEEIEKDYSP